MMNEKMIIRGERIAVRIIIMNAICTLLTSVVIAAFVYFALDYPMAIKKVIMVLVFAPVAGMACYYTAKMKLKIEVAACISSFYILLSIVVMSAMIIALQSI